MRLDNRSQITKGQYFLQIPDNGWDLGKSELEIPKPQIPRPSDSKQDKKYAYRGLMIDAGRNYFSHRVGASKPFWEEIVDLLAQLELNYLHMHLTEDQETINHFKPGLGLLPCS